MFQPEIPNNTGNIGRTAIASGCALHLIHPLGFSTSVKALRRAGLDYWPRLAPAEHQTWDAYLASARSPNIWLFSTKATRTIYDAPIAPGDHLVFGPETRGLPDDLLAAHPERTVTLPMMPGERSLNVATAVCAVIYVALGRFIADGRVRLGSDGRIESWKGDSEAAGV